MNNIETFWTAIAAGDQAQVQALTADQPKLLVEKHDSGHGAARLACECGHLELGRWLAANGASLDIFDSVILNQREVVQAALKNDRSLLKATSHDGWTLLHLAAFAGHPELVRTLLEAGATASAVSKNSMKNTPLHAAIAGACNLECIDQLIGLTPVDAVAANGVTALHLAASRGADQTVTLLLKRGANHRLQMADGQTPSDLARTRGFVALADRLATM